MSYFRTKNNDDKVFRGAYTYSRNNNMYCEETFDVYRDKKDSSHTFQAQLISRVATGELLNVSVDYMVNKDFTPTSVVINRSLGEEKVSEMFTFDQRKTRIHYSFIDKDGETKVELNTTPKFQIATPCMCTSMCFLRSKKFDSTGKNYYNLLGSKNMWKFEEDPQFRNIIVQKLSSTSENLTLDGNTVQAINYRIQEQVEDDNEEPPTLNIWLSQHLTIPYQVQTPDGTKIQVKYLNNLDKDQ